MSEQTNSEAGFEARAETEAQVAIAKGQMMQELWDALKLPAAPFSVATGWDAAIDVLKGHAEDQDPYMVGIGSLIVDRAYVMAADKRRAARDA